MTHDDDDAKKKPDTSEEEPNVEAGDYNLGDDLGKKVGEGNDDAENAV